MKKRQVYHRLTRDPAETLPPLPSMAVLEQVISPAKKSGRRRHYMEAIFYILEGEVTLTDQDGESLSVRAGHQVFVPIGSTVRWDVKEKRRKVFHIRTDEPLGEAG